jgi:hypothetical protein
MSSDLVLFGEYDWLFRTNFQLQRILVVVFIDVIKFWTLTVKYLRRSPQS